MTHKYLKIGNRLMSFKTFVTIMEGEYANKAMLVLQSFIDNLKSAHYDNDGNKLTFNVGNAIKLAKFSNLEIVLRSGNEVSVKLGKRTDSDTYAVVVDLKHVPTIREVYKVLEHPKIMQPVVAEIEKYLGITRSQDNKIDDSKLTNYERIKKYNSDESFEETYTEFVKRLKQKRLELDKMISNFEEQKASTGNSSRKVTLDLAIEKLKSDYFGKTFKDFKSKAYSLLNEIHQGFRENLNKENKEILEDRLEQIYKTIQ